MNHVGVGFRNVVEFGAGLGATVWIKLCNIRDVSPEYSCVYFWACNGDVFVFFLHLVILLHMCLCLPWKFLIRLSYIAVIIYSSHTAT